MPSPGDLRATFAPILRRWIVDKNFFRIQKVLRPQQILFDLYSRADEVKYCQAGVYVWWMGAVRVGGGQLIGASQLAPKYLADSTKVPQARQPFTIQQKAKLFFEQPCFL